MQNTRFAVTIYFMTLYKISSIYFENEISFSARVSQQGYYINPVKISSLQEAI